MDYCDNCRNTGIWFSESLHIFCSCVKGEDRKALILRDYLRMLDEQSSWFRRIMDV